MPNTHFIFMSLFFLALLCFVIFVNTLEINRACNNNETVNHINCTQWKEHIEQGNQEIEQYLNPWNHSPTSH